MPGFSLTLLLLPFDDEYPSPSHLLSLLDEPVDTPGWKWTPGAPPSKVVLTKQVEQSRSQGGPSAKSNSQSASVFVDAITQACQGLIKAEPDITRMDQIAGDGDCGMTLKAGAEGADLFISIGLDADRCLIYEGVLAAIHRGEISEDVPRSFIIIAQVAEECMGGTSGALYAIYFAAFAQHMHKATSVDSISREDWSAALTAALERLYTYTRARPPSRTLVDPLAAFTEAYGKHNLVAAVQAAADATEQTRGLDAMAGRSAYVEGDRLKAEKVADPGAWGVKVCLFCVLHGKPRS